MFVSRFALSLIAFAVAARVVGAQEPAEELPPGAVSRFGVSRYILRTGPRVALTFPKCKSFLAPTVDGGIRKYDLETGKPFEENLIVGPGQVVLSADGKRAAVARPGGLAIVDAVTGAQILAIDPPDGFAFAGTPGVSMSADGKRVAYGARGPMGLGTAVVHEIDTNALIAHVETAQRPPIVPVLSADGKTLATHGYVPPPPPKRDDGKPEPKGEILADAMRMVQVWDVAGKIELFRARVTGMGGAVSCAAFSADGGILAASAGDGPTDVWDVGTGKRLQTLLGRKAQGSRIAISPDGKMIASIAPDYRTERWTVDGKLIDVTEGPQSILHVPVTGFAFADNERVVAWVTAANFCVAWEAPAGKLLSPVMDHLAGIKSVAFPLDKTKDTLTSGLEGKIYRWDILTGNITGSVTLRPARLPLQPLVRPVVTFSRDGTLGVGQKTPIEVFDINEGGDLFCVPMPSAPQSPVLRESTWDGAKLILMSRQADDRPQGTCVIWDLTTQKRFAEFEIPLVALPSLPTSGLSPDGTRMMFAAASDRASLTMVGYDIKTGKTLSEMDDDRAAGTIHLGLIDESTAVVASSKGRIWEVDYAKGRIGADFDNLVERGEPAISCPIVFSPDGKRFAVGVVGKSYTTYGVRVYDVQTRKLTHSYVGHRAPVTCLRFNDIGDILASGSHDTSVLLWDVSRATARK